MRKRKRARSPMKIWRNHSKGPNARDGSILKGNARSDISFRICLGGNIPGWSWGSGWRGGLGSWEGPECCRRISLRCRSGARLDEGERPGVSLQTRPPLRTQVPLVGMCSGSQWLRVMHTASLVASHNWAPPYHNSHRPQAQRHNSSPICNNNGSIWSGSRRLIVPLCGPSPRHLEL